MVDVECIHRIVFAMRAARPEWLKHDPDLLGMCLLEMNRRALVARYGDNNNADAVPPYRYCEPRPRPTLLVQVYKSLRCYLYQCSEGDVPHMTLFLQIDAMRKHIAQALGHRGETWSRPEIKAIYDKCEWG